MRIEITELIKDKAAEINDFFQKAGDINHKDIEQYKADDYTYLKESVVFFGEFTVPYFLTYSVTKDLEYRIKHSYIHSIWYWKKDVDQNISQDFLPTQTELMHSTLVSYLSLIKTGNYKQALIIFRSYIEYSCQFYASILDYDFFQKYTTTDVSEKDFMTLWFQSLKPEKVQNRIKKMHEEINSLLKEGKIVYAGNAVYRRRFHPFDSQLRGKLYKELSGLAHGKHMILAKNDDTQLYALIWLCSAYLVETMAVIDELTSVYFKYTLRELFTKWITIEIYCKMREPKAEIYFGKV